MTENIDKTKQSLEEIAQEARAIKNSLLPIEKRIRESLVEVPKTVILRRLYDEICTIQRIASRRPAKTDSGEELTYRQASAIASFATALYMPLNPKDFAFSYRDFYKEPSDTGLHGLNPVLERNSLDLLLEVQGLLYPRFKVVVKSSNFAGRSNYLYIPIEENELRLFHIDEETRVNDLLSNFFYFDGIMRSRDDPRSRNKQRNEHILRNLQYFHSLEIEEPVSKYLELLRGVREKLKDFMEFDLENIKERTIPLHLPNVKIKTSRRKLSEEFSLEEKKIIRKMIASDDWTESLGEILDFIEEVKRPEKYHRLKRYRVLLGDKEFTPFQLTPAPIREEIVGIDENLTRLEALVRGYAKGHSTPNIVLIGPPGTGKTTSLKYVIEVTKDLDGVRYFLMNDLENIRALAELGSEYRPIGLIDDMFGEINSTTYNRLKQQLEGLGGNLIEHTLIITSANTEIWQYVPDPVKQRLGPVEIQYASDHKSYKPLVKQFCSKFGVEYRDSLMDEVKKMVPRQIRDHIRALGAEEAGKSRDYIRLVEAEGRKS